MTDEKHFGPVWFIPGKNKGKYPYCHSIYVKEAGILIDPASDRERLMSLRKDEGVTEIWLSHWHEDHFTHLDLFDDLPLRIMALDAPPLSGLDPLMDAYGIDEAYRKEWRSIFLDFFHFKPRIPTRLLGDGEKIDLGVSQVSVIAAPGHTPGHMALYFDEPELLFMADYDLSRFGPWYGDVDSDIDKTIQSVNALRNIRAKTWLTSHEKGIFEQDPGEIWDRYLDVIRIREQKLLTLLETPRTMPEIVSAWIVYGKPREPRHFFEFGEKAIMKKHLERLLQNRIIQFDGSRYGLALTGGRFPHPSDVTQS